MSDNCYGSNIFAYILVSKWSRGSDVVKMAHRTFQSIELYLTITRENCEIGTSL